MTMLYAAIRKAVVGAFFIAVVLPAAAHVGQAWAGHGSAERPAVLADGGGNWIGGGGAGSTGP